MIDPYALVIQPEIVNDLGMRAIWAPNEVLAYPTMSDRNEGMPYIVFDISIFDSGDQAFALQPGLLTFDVWDFGPNNERAIAIVQRLKELFSRGIFAAGGKPGALRIYGSRHIGIETDNQNVWHRELTFKIRGYDVLTVANLVTP